MRFRRLLSLRHTVLTLVFFATFLRAQTPTPAHVATIQGLGKGTADLAGPWQFHLGDNLEWAQPNVEDASGHDGWESILPDRPWGAQSHYAYTGFAWYRLHLNITPAPGVTSSFPACSSQGWRCMRSVLEWQDGGALR
jgi:hypothetical protein